MLLRRNALIILPLASVGLAGTAHARDALIDSVGGPANVIVGVGRDAERAVEAGALVARRVIDFLRNKPAFGRPVQVADFVLDTHPRNPSLLGVRISGSARHLLSQGNAGQPYYSVTGHLQRLENDAILHYSINRLSDGAYFPATRILLLAMGPRSHQGILSAEKPW